jgi:hypothetical protein
LARRLEVEKLAQADSQDEDGDDVKSEKGAIQGSDGVVVGGAHRRQSIERCGAV